LTSRIHIIERRTKKATMSGNIAITGVPTTPGAGGRVPLRREIRDLQRNSPDQFNLYVLGLRHLQSLDEQQLASFYQIAGIHGMPYKPWNGVGSTTNWASSSGFGGYCTHSSILFTTWHRPYMALYEQALYASVQTVAQQFSAGALRDRYAAAARDFRAPYFDWASQPPSGSSAFPTAIASPNISIVDVDGTTKTVANPINRFIFHPVNPSPGDFNARVRNLSNFDHDGALITFSVVPFPPNRPVPR
jgi:tyrosinase